MKETDAAQFRKTPHGYFVRGRTWLVWSWDRTLGGFTLWGTPDANDAAAVVELFDLPPTPEPLDVLVDARRVEGVEPTGFAKFTAGLTRHLPVVEKVVRRTAVVLPGGWVGAVVAGVQHVVGSRYRWQTFSSMEPALEFLARRELPEALQEVAALVDETMNQQPLVPRLEDFLAQRGFDVTIHDAALELGVSVRSLQRALSDGGTTYRDEVIRSRRLLAQKLLAETDDKLESVALSAGFSSLQHFSTQFKRWTGMTPSDYRARGRQRA